MTLSPGLKYKVFKNRALGSALPVAPGVIIAWLSHAIPSGHHSRPTAESPWQTNRSRALHYLGRGARGGQNGGMEGGRDGRGMRRRRRRGAGEASGGAWPAI